MFSFSIASREGLAAGSMVVYPSMSLVINQITILYIMWYLEGQQKKKTKLSPSLTFHSQPMYGAPAVLHSIHLCFYNSSPGCLWFASFSQCPLLACFSNGAEVPFGAHNQSIANVSLLCLCRWTLLKGHLESISSMPSV